MRQIRLSKGLTSLVDDSAYEDLSQFSWHALTVRGKHYAARNVSKSPRRYELMHRRIAGCSRGDGSQVDHINGDGLDNRLENLRTCSLKQNRRNSALSRMRKTSKFKGVSWHAQRSRWVANICVDCKTKYLGLFVEETEAARAYDTAARRLFGEFCALNFPNSGERNALSGYVEPLTDDTGAS